MPRQTPLDVSVSIGINNKQDNIDLYIFDQFNIQSKILCHLHRRWPIGQLKKCLVMLVSIILISSCSPDSKINESVKTYSGLGTNQLYVVSHGRHTGLVIPSKFVFIGIPDLFKRFERTSYIEFGWGDKEFYQATEITTALTLKALFLPTESVVHAVGVHNEVRTYFANSEIEELLLTDKEMLSLVQFIGRSLARDDQDVPIATKAGVYGDSQFYTGKGDYYLMNTCNIWTAQGLKSFGMDISPTFKFTSGSVMNYIRLNNRLTRSKNNRL
jgi:uncharacterized protein (TIGR02117 family)